MIRRAQDQQDQPTSHDEPAPAPQEHEAPAIDLDNADHTAEVLHPESGDHGSVPLFQDTATWVLIPFLIVLAIIWKTTKGGKVATDALDAKSKKIADELESARQIREEAQSLLAQYQRRQREAEDEAQAIIDQAKKDAKRLSKEARLKLDEQLERQTKAAEGKIARAEAQAIADVRAQTAELAAAAAENIVAERVKAQGQNALVEKAITDLSSKLN
ncbi:MAG: F0F1 ATP synthase subunit B [Parvularculaceae bacterium]